jgi:hypothetical protein
MLFCKFECYRLMEEIFALTLDRRSIGAPVKEDDGSVCFPFIVFARSLLPSSHLAIISLDFFLAHGLLTIHYLYTDRATACRRDISLRFQSPCSCYQDVRRPFC